MLNETIEGLLGTSLEWWEIVSLIAAVIGILWYLQDKILPKITHSRSHKEDFKELFLYKKSKYLQQSDFGIQHPPEANKDVYKRKKSDDAIENYLKDSKDLLVIGMPKAGKTRSTYQAMKLVLPDFYVIRPPAEKLPDFIFPRFKKNYLLFFDDLNKFTDVDFDFKRFLDKFERKSKRVVILSTCRSGDELDTVKSKSMEFFRRFEILDLNNYPLSEAEGEQLAEDAGVEWKPKQFNGTPGSVVLDDENMKERYRHLDDRQKAILRTCKLLRSANIFTYKKDLIKNVCDNILETKINENNWIDLINGLGGNSFITNPERSFNRVDMYDSTLDSVVDDYSPEDHYNLGVLLKDQGRYDEAVKEWRDTIRADPDDAAAHYNLGVLLKDQGRYDEAEKEYRDAIRADPDLAAAHSNLGSLLNDLERYDEAEEEYRDAIRADPDLAEPHANLCLLFLKTERPEEAKKEFEVAKELFKNQGRDEYVKKVEELLSRT
jgi:tetratricopeptide (TPR) repeat protein